MFGLVSQFDATTKASDLDSNNDFKTKQYYRKNKLSGLYQEFDPFTDQLKEEGYFQNGVETGKWKVIDQDGDQIHYLYQMVRVGARCRDGTFSQATGRGACSWHGGVSEWLMGSQKTKVGGTGKHVPPEQRVEALKSKVKTELATNKTGLQLEQQILRSALKDKEQIRALKKQLQDAKQQLSKKQVQASKQLKTQTKQKLVSDGSNISKDLGDKVKTEPKFHRKRQQQKPAPQELVPSKDKPTIVKKSQNSIETTEKISKKNNQDQLRTQKLRDSFLKYKLKQPEKQQEDSTIRSIQSSSTEKQSRIQNLRNSFQKYKLKQPERQEEEEDSESDSEQRSQNQSELIKELLQKMNISDSR